jgi:hypothetical protein
MRASTAFFAAFPALGSVIGVVAGFAGVAGRAQADEPALRLMRESIPYTEVLDAADADDLFDLNAHVAFNRSTDRGTIQREYTSTSGERKRASVADSERTISSLMFGLDVGLFRDLMAFVRLPLTLSDARSLSAPSGKSVADVSARLTDPNDYGGAKGELFKVPFESPTRAGFDSIGIGASWGVLSQQREPYYPTWLIMIEGRRAIGTPFKPCAQVADETICGAKTGQDQNGDGKDDGTARLFADQSSGSSRGVSGILVETRASYRYRYLEPYVGLGFLMEWASTGKKYFNPTGNLDGTINALPSRTATATLGTAVIPWENRARFQRFALDLRLTGAHLSEGHDYSALYDALGTSKHAELSRPNREGYQPGANGVFDDPNSASFDDEGVGSKVPFYGLTDIQSRLKYGLRVGLEMQAAQYVRFAFGSALNWVTAHAITAADPCNPDFSDATRASAIRGNECTPGIVNPGQRPTIDSPGRRFWMSSELVLDIYATATAQF